MENAYGYTELSNLLGLDAPLLMLDSLQLDVNGHRAEGLKYVSAGEEVFRGHFPERPILPGVLQVAAMVQASKALFLASREGAGEVALARLRRVRFRQPVYPGAILHILAEERETNGDEVEYKVKCTLDNGEVASDGSLFLRRRAPGWFTRPSVAADALQTACSGECVGVEEIMHVIPHRNPFLLLDGACSGADGAFSGFKNVTGNEPMVRATASCTYPAFLQVESCAQLGCWAALSKPEHAGKLGIFMSIDEATVLRPVWAGERFTMKLALEITGKYGVATCQGLVAEEPALEVTLKFAVL